MSSRLHTMYRRLRYGEPIVIVSGLPRSGTSMTMKMLQAGGMELVTDELREADEDNPKGYFELERVKQLEAEPDKSYLRKFRGKALKVISFLLKDLPKDNNYAVLFMHRNLDEVLASQAKMLTRRKETSQTSDDKMKQLWEDHLWKVNYRLSHEPHFEALHIQYKQVIEDPRREAARIVDFLGKDLDLENMTHAVDERLYRNRR